MRPKIRYLRRHLGNRLKRFCPVFALLVLMFIVKVEVGQSFLKITYLETQGYVAKNVRANGSDVTSTDEANVNDGETIKVSLKTTVTGERNAATVQTVCQSYNQTAPTFTLTVRWDKENKLLLCPTYKVGTTFWRRVFMVQRETQYKHLTNPYEISFQKEYKSAKLTWNNSTHLPAYKVMFTRDPYVRLFSFYVDKLLAPNPVFWKTIGTKIVKKFRGSNSGKPCGHDVTFKEFIKYVIHTLETNKDIDPHWVQMTSNCHPCEMKYDFVGTMENFAEDSLYIIRKLGLQKMADFLEQNGSDVATDDAIVDTLSQIFTFRIKYRPCISFRDAVSRAWTKLQVRGLVANETIRDLVLDERKTRINALQNIAYRSRNSSDCSQRKQFKNQIFKEYWNSVDKTDIEKLRKLYKDDFRIFGYDDKSVLFS